MNRPIRGERSMDWRLVAAAFDYGRKLGDVKLIELIDAAEVSYGRYKPTSQINEDISKMWGPDGAPNDGKLWTKEEWDALIDDFLAGASIRQLCLKFKRSKDSVDCKLRLTMKRRIPQTGKVREGHGYRYPLKGASTKRSDRNVHYTDRDDYVLAQANMPHGVECGANDPRYIAALLRRTPESVRKHVEEIIRRSDDRGFGLSGAKQAADGGKQSEVLRSELEAIVSKINSEFGFI